MCIATVYNNFANLLSDQVKVMNHWDITWNAKRLRRDLPSNHPDLARECKNLAIVFSNQGQHEELLNYFLSYK